MNGVEPLRRPLPNWDTIAPICVLFDFGGTLDANGVAWKERFFRLFRDEGVGIAPSDSIPCSMPQMMRWWARSQPPFRCETPQRASCMG